MILRAAHTMVLCNIIARVMGEDKSINDKLMGINGELFNGPLMGINGDITAGGAPASPARALMGNYTDN